MSSWSSRWLVGTIVVVVVLAVASVVAALATGGDVGSFPEGSPEGVVQRYLQEVEEGDVHAAHGYLVGDLQERCALQDLREYAGRSYRVLLEDVTEADSEAVVTVRITILRTGEPGWSYAPLESSFIRAYYLEREDGRWRFTEPPWPFAYCPPKPAPAPTQAEDPA